MSSNIIYDTIRNTVLSYIPGARVLLFGSRARGTSDRHSDYDMLIITPGIFTPKEKINWSTTINTAIVKAIHAPVDLLFYSEEEIHQKQQLPGHIVRSAIREGIAI